MKRLLVLSLLALTGCAVPLDPGAEKIGIMTSNQKELQCTSLGLVSVEQRVGPNKPSNAMNKALNEVAKRGGNGIYMVSNNVDWAEGASVVAEALKCSGDRAAR